MNSDTIDKLEKNYKLKKKIFGKGIWKNYAIIPPTLVLFAGVLGIVYLLNIDKIITWYAIPFAGIFVLGTIWFKATKTYLINKKISDKDPFIVCLSIPFMKKDKKTIMLFSTGKNRNNKFYLEKEKKDIIENSDFNIDKINKKTISFNNSDIHLTILPFINIFNKGSHIPNTESWLVYTGNQQVTFLSKEDIKRYT